MKQHSAYDILFEPVAIGPVTAPNRFYQVPHCNGMGHAKPQTVAAMRGVKAEGGWGVISTEEVEIHPTSEISPYAEGRLWDDADIAAMTLMTDAVHAHGSLAAIELCHNGLHAPNRMSRIPPMGPSHIPVDGSDPVQARAMTEVDIGNFIRWHRDAALRARKAGFDIIYVYAGHSMSTLMHFMQRKYNNRTDAYGGSLENRVRLSRQTIEAVKEAVGDTCGVAFRCAVDEMMGPDGISSSAEGRDTVEALAELPDLWDVNVSNWGNDSATARFEPSEGYQDAYTGFVKSVTTKPVVGVGRYTSVDAMVSRIKSGKLDFIGAARPSIADPWLPNKIREGRPEEIRECIGCNICVSGDNQIVPMRCTQNPTVGEEWRRSWHPEKIAPAASNDSVLIVGAGPAGLECALQIANRGYEVAIAEASSEVGGRLLGESRLPGMASYLRVRDYRLGLLQQKANCSLYLESRLAAEEVIEFGAQHVLLATGSRWVRDGSGRYYGVGSIEGSDTSHVYTPDDVFAGQSLSGNVVVFDDDHYYMGSLIAEHLADSGCSVTLVTPAPMISGWAEHTLEQPFVHKRLLEKGVTVTTDHGIGEIRSDSCSLACVHTRARTDVSADAVVLVTARQPERALHDSIQNALASGNSSFRTLELIGDCLAPGTVAAAVYLGHLAARCLEGESWDAGLYKREMPDLIRHA